MKRFCDGIGRRDMHDTSGDQNLLRVVEHSGVAFDRSPGLGASRWPGSRNIKYKRGSDGRREEYKVETHLSSRPSAAPSRPDPVRIPCPHKDNKPVSQGMRVGKSSRVETRAKSRYSRIGR